LAASPRTIAFAPRAVRSNAITETGDTGMADRRGTIAIETLTGAIDPAVFDALAELRIAVFRAFPYLYEGDLAYERDYLAALASARYAIIVTARDKAADGRIVGCATGSALKGQHEEFAAPLLAAGRDAARTFYFGESVLLEAYRGRGIGHAFFDEREGWARSRGYERASFCAVIRPDDHPSRPADHRPLDPFWRARGYRPIKGAIAQFEWRDVDRAKVDAKPMQIWERMLD
jgi:GNAT superfamily N-acetyltransferase